MRYPILGAKNASTHSSSIARRSSRLYIVNIVCLSLLLAPPFTRYSSPSILPPLYPSSPSPSDADQLTHTQCRSPESISTTAGAVRVAPSSANAMDVERLEELLGRLDAQVRASEADEGARWEPVRAFSFGSLFLFSLISITGSSSRVRDLRHEVRGHERVCALSSAGDGLCALP
jgi:hypothetical protein